MRTSLVVPMFNEAGHIEATVNRIADSAMVEGLELLLVDDGSSDGTGAVARDVLDRRGLNGQVLCIPVRAGKGGAVQVGVQHANAPVVVFADADLSAGAEQVERVIDHLGRGSVDMVIASRRHADSEIETSPPWRRRVAARAFNLVARGLGLTDRDDTQCGLKGFTSDAARELFAELVSTGFAFDVEVLIRADRLGLTVEELPVRWSYDPHSSVRVAAHAAATLRDLIRIRRRYGSARRPRPV